MRNYYKTKCVFLLISGLISFNALAETGELIVQINSAADNKGVVKVYILNSAAQFNDPKESFKQCSQTIAQRKVTCSFKALPYDDYAIFSFQDRNQDGDLNTSFMGSPNEKLAISNIDLSENDDPSFKQSSFRLSTPQAQVFMNLQ
jgi:uncharacterized protein (DUF2141 family)